MKKVSMNQVNETWRNARLTITAIIFPAVGLLIGAYAICTPFRNWADEKLSKIFNK